MLEFVIIWYIFCSLTKYLFLLTLLYDATNTSNNNYNYSEVTSIYIVYTKIHLKKKKKSKVRDDEKNRIGPAGELPWITTF